MKTITLPNGEETGIPKPSFPLKWEDAGIVPTKVGERHLFTAPMHHDFWPYWKAHSAQLKRVGISCHKDKRQNWSIVCWLTPNKKDQANLASFDKKMILLSRGETPSASFVPKIAKGEKPFPYQSAGVEYALGKERVIIGDDMGLGKTLQAIMVCNHENAKKVLVVCPASLRMNWEEEWAKFATDQSVTTACVFSKDDFHHIKNADVIFISYGLVIVNEAQAAIRSITWDAVIVDEAHFLQNPITKRSTALLGLPPRARCKDDEVPRAPVPAKRWMFLTGTPVSNKPINFWNILRFCSPEHFGQKSRFALRFCGGKRGFGNAIDDSGSSNLEELQTVVRGTCMVRRMKRHVLKQLPAKTRKIVALPAPDEILREVNALTMDFETSAKTIKEIEKRVEESKRAGDSSEMAKAVEGLREAKSVHFSQMAKVRKQIGLAKVEIAIAHIKSTFLENNGGKLIVGVYHQEVADQLVEGLKSFNPVVITGSVDSRKRHAAVDSFQNDPKCRLFIGNILAAGTGLTLTASSHAIIVEPDWVPANNIQFEDRAHRIGQKNPVLIEYLAMEKTVDIQVLKTNARKLDIIERSTDRVSDLERKINMADNGGTNEDCELQLLGDQSPVDPIKTKKESEEDERAIRQKKLETAKLGKSLSPRELMIAHQCVKRVLSFDTDGAKELNGLGFSKFDHRHGKRLCESALRHLSDFDRGTVAILAWRYRRQCYERQVAFLRKP
jgi:SWI/SNF-related matrix-associated actin-dependent regulator 1 of chromatin subfamily A